MSTLKNKARLRRRRCMGMLTVAVFLSMGMAGTATAQTTIDSSITNLTGTTGTGNINPYDGIIVEDTNAGTSISISWNDTSISSNGLAVGSTNDQKVTIILQGSFTIVGGILVADSANGGLKLDLNGNSLDVTGAITGGTGAGLTIDGTSGIFTVETAVTGTVTLTGGASVDGASTIGANANITIDTAATGAWATTGDIVGAGVVIINNTNYAAKASFGNIASGGSVTATNATFAGMAGGELIADGAAYVDGNVTGTGNKIDGANATGDSAIIYGNIGDGTTADLTIGGAAGLAVAIAGDIKDDAIITIDNDSTLSQTGAVTGTGVVVTNNGSGAVNLGHVATGAEVTGTDVVFAGMAGGQVTANGHVDINGDIIGPGNTIDGTTGVSADTATITGDIGSITTDLIIGGAAGLAVTIAGDIKDDAIITIDNDSTLLQTGAVTGTGVVVTNNGSGAVNLGQIASGAEVTGTNVAFNGMAGGQLTANGHVDINGDITGTGNTIFGADNTNNNTLTVGNTLTIGNGSQTSLVIGKSGSKVTVQDEVGGTNITGGTGPDYTTIKAVEGSVVNLANTDLADGNFNIGTDGKTGSQMTVGDIGDDGVSTTVAVEGNATAGVITGDATYKTTIKGGTGGGTLTANIAGTNGNTVYVDGNDGQITIATDSIGNTSGSGAGVTIDIVGDGNFTAANGTDKTTLDGKVTVNAGTGTDVQFGDIDNNNSPGVNDDITLNAVNGGKVTTGDISGGAQVAANTDNGKVNIGNVSDSGTQLDATAESNGTVNVGDISNGAQVAADADNGKVNIGNVSGSGTQLDATAKNNGLITIKDITDQAVVNATGDEATNGLVTIESVDNATVNASGNVKIGGQVVNVGVGVDVNTLDNAVTMTGIYTGEQNHFYAINKAAGENPAANANPYNHNILVNGAVIGGSTTTKTEVTFGAKPNLIGPGYDPTKLGAVNVTDSRNEINYGGVIDGSGLGTTINIVGDSVFNLANTLVQNGTTTFNIDNSGAQATIGGQKNGTIIASTSNINGATLVNAGDVTGSAAIQKDGGSAGDINYQINGAIGGDGSESTNFTIQQGIYVTANNINGGTVGTTVNVGSGAGFQQDQNGQISGNVTFNSNTDEATNLGQLQNGASLTYSSSAGAGDTVLAGSANGASATVINNSTNGALKVANTGDYSTTTFSGAGDTIIEDTGDYSTSTVRGQATVYGTGNNATTTVEDGGLVTLANDGSSSIGSNNSLAINDGTAVFGSGVNTTFLSGLITVAMNSANGESVLTNNAASALAGNLNAQTGNNDVVVNTGNGLGLSGDANLTGNGTGAFKIVGEAIDLNNNDLNLEGANNLDFSQSTDGTGFSGLNALNTNADGTTIAFVGDWGYLNAQTANIKGSTVYDANLAVGGSGTGNNTIYADTLNVNDSLLVNGALSLASGATLNFDATADYANGGTAITVNGNVSIAHSTVFGVDNQTQTAYFQVVGGANVSSGEWANMSYINGNGLDNAGNAHFFDWTTGYYSFIIDSEVRAARANAPYFAKAYIESLLSKNPALAVHMGTNSTNKEISLAMGNTLNAALMTANPLNPVLQNLNALPKTNQATANRVWAIPNFSSRSIDGNYNKGYGDVEIKSFGITLGADRRFNERFLAGGFLAINDARLTGDASTIDSTDVQAGLYARAMLVNDLMLNFGLAYGKQNYDAKRDVYVGGMPTANQRISSDFDGDSLAFSAEISRNFSLGHGMALRPGLSYAYLGIWLDAYDERSSLAYSQPLRSLAQQVDKSNFNLHLLRLGTDVSWADATTGVTGRIYYIRNLGDDRPITKANFHNVNTGTPGFEIGGAPYAKDTLNLGLSLGLSPTDNIRVSLNYDALLGSGSQSHNANLSFSFTW